MIIQNAKYSIIYPKVDNIRKDIFSFEEELGALFAKPFALIPIPDNAPSEIPRISATSHHGHSNLNISPNTIQFTVNYDDRYWSNKEKCLSYINDHVKKIYSAISCKINDEFLFSGLTLNILFNELKEDPIDILKKNFCRINSATRPYDINSKITFVIDNKYYVNITCANVRRYEGRKSNGVGSLSNMKLISHDVGINLDINDRYAFNYNPEYTSGPSEIDKILKLSDGILTEKIRKFIREGKIDL